MSKYIKLEEAIDVANKECHEFRGIFSRIKEGMNAVSTIDIVRCGECKYAEECEQIVVFDIGENQIEGRKIDFCSDGERIDNE